MGIFKDYEKFLFSPFMKYSFSFLFGFFVSIIILFPFSLIFKVNEEVADNLPWYFFLIIGLSIIIYTIFGGICGVIIYHKKIRKK